MVRQTTPAIDETSLADLFEQAPGFMAVSAGRNHVMQFANQAFVTLTGRSDFIGKPIAEALPELAEQGFAALLDHVYASGEPFQGRATPVSMSRKGAGTETRFVDFVYQPIRDGDGEIIGIFTNGYDVTDQKNAQDEIQLLQSNLIHISRVSAMGTMAATLAHELNQPLTAISTYLAGGLRMVGSDQPIDRAALSKALDHAKDAALRAGDVIRRLRDMTVRGKARKSWFNVAEAVREACSLAMMGPENEAIARISDIPPNLVAFGDRTQIQQVMINLLRNASDAMAGSVDRRLFVAAHEQGSAVTVSVSDTGPGLSAGARSTLFEPFNSTKAGGMGVGLSISRTIIEAHDGRIWAEDRDGGGATFRFTLPPPDHDGR